MRELAHANCALCARNRNRREADSDKARYLEQAFSYGSQLMPEGVLTELFFNDAGYERRSVVQSTGQMPLPLLAPAAITIILRSSEFGTIILKSSEFGAKL